MVTGGIHNVSSFSFALSQPHQQNTIGTRNRNLIRSRLRSHPQLLLVCIPKLDWVWNYDYYLSEQLGNDNPTTKGRSPTHLLSAPPLGDSFLRLRLFYVIL